MPLRSPWLRVLLIGPTLLGVFSLTFLLFQVLPGDPTLSILGEFANATARANLRRELGLDRPLPEQYVQYLGRALSGDFGNSLISRRPALGTVLQVAPASVSLAGAGIVWALMLGVPLGVAAALRPHTWVDRAANAIALLGAALPSFWVAQLALLIFAGWLQLFPSVAPTAAAGPLAQLHALILPAAVLGCSIAAPLTRLTRATLLQILAQPYITAARARGITEWSIGLRHALRGALPPLLAATGGLLGWALGNAVLIETVFARPGLGSLLVTAVSTRDLPLVQASLAVIAVGVVLINALLELLYQYADPRLR